VFSVGVGLFIYDFFRRMPRAETIGEPEAAVARGEPQPATR
jgi:hypothetical protein